MSLGVLNSRKISDIVPERRRHGYRNMHPYFGKLDTALSRFAIEQFSRPGDVVLDPFCGSGAVLAESLLVGRSAIGWDSSPLAHLIATAKVMSIEKGDKTALVAMRQELECYVDPRPMFREKMPASCYLPDMPRVRDVSSWFGEHAVRELGFIKEFIDARKARLTLSAWLLARVAFSRIVIASSNQQGESSYRRIAKPDVIGRVVSLFIEAIDKVIQAAEDFTDNLAVDAESLKRIAFAFSPKVGKAVWSDREVSVVLRDSRFSGNHKKVAVKADLVVTSPPYLMSWDYGLYHKFRFYWLGFDLDGYEESEIGRHLRRKDDDLVRYQQDMSGVFKSLSPALNKRAKIVMVNAPSVVYGKLVDTNSVLAECAERVGWRLMQCTESIAIPGPHHGMYASLAARGAKAPGRTGKCEHVLVFERA